jgi:aspartate aminotransferase-like enzyme
MFVPGPVDVADEVLQAQTKPMIPHRSTQFEEIFHRTSDRMEEIFKTKYRVFITPSTGTGLHEAAVRNFVNPGGKMLSLVNGAFGKRWYDVGKLNGKDADIYETQWNEPIRGEDVAKLIDGKKYQIVTVIHNETSTGLMNPVEEISKVIKEVSPETILCVDTVSSMAGTKIEMDAWGVDYMLTSSQKCLALPPGIAFAAVSDRAMERAARVEQRGWYFDFLRLEKHRTTNSMPTTAPISLFYALDVQLERILNQEGLENRWARHTAMAKASAEWAAKHGLSLYAPEGYRSQTVTTINNDLEYDFSGLNKFLIDNGTRITNGYGSLKNRTFRIGHMGETTLEDCENLFDLMDNFING